MTLKKRKLLISFLRFFYNQTDLNNIIECV